MYFIQSLDPQELANRFSTHDSLSPLPSPNEEWKDNHLDKIKAVMDRLPDREADLVHLYFFLNKKQTDIAEIFNITQAAVSYRLKRALARIRFLIELPEVTKDDVYEDLKPFMATNLDARIFSEMFESTCQSEVANILGISQGRVRHRYIANLDKLGWVFVDKITAWINKHPNCVETKTLKVHVNKVLSLKNHAENKAKDIEAVLKEAVSYILDLPEELHCEELYLFAQYYLTFVKIRYNFNILREIKLPKWSGRSKKSIS